MKQTKLIFDSHKDVIDDYKSVRRDYNKEVERYKVMVWYGFLDEPMLMR
jgi:hypothetical protein